MVNLPWRKAILAAIDVVGPAELTDAVGHLARGFARTAAGPTPGGPPPSGTRSYPAPGSVPGNSHESPSQEAVPDHDG